MNHTANIISLLIRSGEKDLAMLVLDKATDRGSSRGISGEWNQETLLAITSLRFEHKLHPEVRHLLRALAHTYGDHLCDDF